MCDKFKVCISSEWDGYANIQTMWNVSFDKTWSYWNFLEYLFLSMQTSAWLSFLKSVF